MADNNAAAGLDSTHSFLQHTADGAWDEYNEVYIYEESVYFRESGEPILLFCN